MYISPQLPLIWPLEGKRLARHNNQLCCENGHSFDIARQGYINLLPVQQKNSRDPGDSKEMIASRHRFLESGHYTPISKTLNELIPGLLTKSCSINILDAGCGEGFYLQHCQRYLKTTAPDKTIAYLGMDISKAAIIAAAKRAKDITWVVGTNKHPPVETGSIDIAICMFGYYDPAVFARILKPSGYVILADPGPEHLLELRKIIYPYIKESSVQECVTAMDLCNENSLRYSMALNKEQISDLLIMTPHLYRAPRAGKEAVRDLLEIDLTVDVLFRIYQFEQI